MVSNNTGAKVLLIAVFGVLLGVSIGGGLCVWFNRPKNTPPSWWPSRKTNKLLAQNHIIRITKKSSLYAYSV